MPGRIVMDKEHERQKWFDLYKTAMLELERAAMTGRIGDARIEIAARLETLKQYPLLHGEEYHAIHDALNNLRVLEREEARLAEEDKKLILRATTQKLKTIEPRLKSAGFGERSADDSASS